MPLDQTQYFDLYQVVVNEIIGDVLLAVIIGLVVIVFLSIKKKMPYELSILFAMLWLVVIFSETNLIIIWTFVVLGVGLMFYFAVSKAIESQ